MHDAYRAVPILDNLPLHIESISCFNGTLLVGTRQGHLLVYEVRTGHGGVPVIVKLKKSIKTMFSKKPLVQVEAVPEFDIVVCLADNLVTVHDLQTLQTLPTLQRTRGASLFALTINRTTSVSGEVTEVLQLCVCIRRKLQMFYWKNREFLEMDSEMSLPDTPRAMAWCHESLVMGFRRDYYLMRRDGTTEELFPTGRQPEPIITAMGADRLILAKDNLSIFVDKDGQPTQKYASTWADVPTGMAYSPPYIIGLIGRGVEILTVEPKASIQEISLPKPKLISSKDGLIYVASTTCVWRLVAIPITTQIKSLLAQERPQFELALSLANLTDETEDDRLQRVHDIESLFAFQLFQEGKYEESLRLYSKLNAEPTAVIGLFTDLLPSEYRTRLVYPSPPKPIQSSNIERAYLSLMDFLTTKRNYLIQNKDSIEATTHKKLFQIVDTTLLKCYLQTNEALVAPLLRLKDNHCHIEESERILTSRNKYSELIILYQKKGLHKKALELLLRHSQRASSPLRGHEMTIRYLQHLGPQHIQLIFDFSVWVLNAHPEDALKIFTDTEIAEVSSLPRDQVLFFLEKSAEELAIPYLKHIVWVCNETGAAFHNRLVHLYRLRIQSLTQDYLSSLPEGQLPAAAGRETGELGQLRRELLVFLESSTHYEPQRLLTHFPFDSFLEERALLLGRLGRHDQALAIYTHLLKDTERANQYCERTYNQGGKEVYASLLKMYLQPPDPASLGVHIGSASSRIQPNLSSAFDVLRDHWHRIDSCRALALLPSNTPLADLEEFLTNVIEERSVELRKNGVLCSLLKGANLRAKGHKVELESIKFVVDEDSICFICKKRIGISAFSRDPLTKHLTHYFCMNDENP